MLAPASEPADELEEGVRRQPEAHQGPDVVQHRQPQVPQQDPARQDVDLSQLPGGMPQLSAIKLVDYDEEKWTAARTETMEKIKDIIVQTR